MTGIKEARVEFNIAAGHLRAAMEHISPSPPNNKSDEDGWDKLNGKIEEFISYIFEESVVS